MNEVRGTLNVLSHVRQGLNQETLTAQKDLNIYSEWWHKVTAASAQDIILPDATGFEAGVSPQFVVQVDGGSSTITVKTYDATTPVTLKAVEAGKAYAFTLVDNSTDEGTWHVNLLEEADQQPSDRYEQTFNATTDWGSASGNLYSITVAAATHGRGLNPEVTVERDDGTNYIPVWLRHRTVKANGDVVISVPETPDLRFAGRLRLI